MLTSLSENKKDFALHDYTLSQTMVWKERKFNKFIEQLEKEFEEIGNHPRLQKTIFTLKRSLGAEPKEIIPPKGDHGAFSFKGEHSN